MRIGMPYLSIALVMAAFGCTRYEWYHPSKNSNVFYSEKNQCVSESIRTYPVLLTQTHISYGYQGPDTTDCIFIGNTLSCNTTRGTYIPPTSATLDLNKSDRNQYFEDCMKSNGWLLVEVKNNSSFESSTLSKNNDTTDKSQNAYPQICKEALLFTSANAIINFCGRCIDQNVLKGKQLAEIYRKRSSAYVNIKEYSKALDDINAAIDMDGESATAYGIRSQIYKDTGDIEKSTDDDKKSKTLKLIQAKQ